MVDTMLTDKRPIQAIWYPGVNAEGHRDGYSIARGWNASKIEVYQENGQCAPVPFFAVYDHDGKLRARVPAQLVTVVYKVEETGE